MPPWPKNRKCKYMAFGSLETKPHNKDNGGEDWSFRSHMVIDREIFITSWNIPSRHLLHYVLHFITNPVLVPADG